MGLYIDGDFERSVPRRESLVAEGYFATIGDDGFSFPGLIDEVAIYNRALSADEIKHILDAGISPLPDLDRHGGARRIIEVIPDLQT